MSGRIHRVHQIANQQPAVMQQVQKAPWKGHIITYLAGAALGLAAIISLVAYAIFSSAKGSSKPTPTVKPHVPKPPTPVKPNPPLASKPNPQLEALKSQRISIYTSNLNDKKEGLAFLQSQKPPLSEAELSKCKVDLMRYERRDQEVIKLLEDEAKQTFKGKELTPDQINRHVDSRVQSEIIKLKAEVHLTQNVHTRQKKEIDLLQKEIAALDKQIEDLKK